MKDCPTIHSVETHTGGMPTRIILDGAPAVPGKTMSERLIWAETNLGSFRKQLMLEPRGHAAMFGALLMPPTSAHADIGVIYMSASGFLPMCGHGTIGVATVLVEKNLVEVTEPITEVGIDTPAGLVKVHVQVKDGKAVSVTFTNVPSFVVASQVAVHIPGSGSHPVDVAYGGNFYAVLDADRIGLPLDVEQLPRLMSVGLALIATVREAVPMKHPLAAEPATLRAAILTREAGNGSPAKNIMIKEPGYFDRSPCGTGTSARMAIAYRQGNLLLGQPFVHESILGTTFEGCLIAEASVGDVKAVVPRISGSAWITGTAEFCLDPTDPFPEGFSF